MAGGTSYRSSGNKLVGVDLVLKRLNEKIKQIEGGTRAGMRKAVSLVKRDSVKGTPIDTGNLRGSAFAETYPGGTFVNQTGVTGVVGYTASYAPFVHEIPKRYKKGRVGFLRAALLKNQLKILRVIKDEAKIK